MSKQIYNTFTDFMKSEYDYKMKMNEVFQGCVDLKDDLHVGSVRRGASTDSVANQGFNILGPNQVEYWADYRTIPEIKDDRRYHIVEKMDDRVFSMGIFEFNRINENGRMFWKKISD
jgi:hypothetical protein